MNILSKSLYDIKTRKLPKIPGPIKTNKSGQLIVQVFPQTFYEKLFFGITIEVWMQPGENLETLKFKQAKAYQTKQESQKLY